MSSVLVLGMHRSGTSLVTRLLSLAGAYVGEDEDLLAGDEWNARGYWEHLAFKEINDRLLALLGASWSDPPRLAEGWLCDAGVQALIAESRGAIEAQFASRSLWAAKDPRSTLLLPFWQSVLGPTRDVVCIRNPLDVADSLARRDRMPIELAAALWHIYTVRALCDTDERDRIILHYDDLARNPRKEAAALFAFVDRTDQLGGAEAGIAGFVDLSLRHHEHTLDDLRESRRVLAPTKRLYESLVRGEPAEIADALRQAEQALDYYYAITGAAAFDAFTDSLRAYKKAEAALQHKTDILGSRMHRLATRVDATLIRLRGPRGSI